MASDVGRYQAGLSRSLDRYKQMVTELQTAKTYAQAELPPELQQAVDIYKTGGEYGAGARTAILEREKQGVAAGQANLVRTGMSSGSVAAGVRARYGREAQRGLQEVEDVRYERLGSALSALSSAKIARGDRISQAYMSSAQLIGGYKEPSVSDYSSPETVANIGAQAGLLGAYLRNKQPTSRYEFGSGFTTKSPYGE